jgi:hypothetical protein
VAEADGKAPLRLTHQEAAERHAREGFGGGAR